MENEVIHVRTPAARHPESQAARTPPRLSGNDGAARPQVDQLDRSSRSRGGRRRRFIFQWIAFNAAYADEQEFQGPASGERAAFADFFEKMVRLDAERRIYNEIWEGFAGPIRVLMQNRYVFNPFWQHHNGIEGYEDWEEKFKASAGAFARSFAAQDTARTLSFVFDRLYVLRNQLVHGGATWNSAVNRDQVRDGASILGFLMPVFVDVMMDNPHEDWGRPFYPVVE